MANIHPPEDAAPLNTKLRTFYKTQQPSDVWLELVIGTINVNSMSSSKIPETRVQKAELKLCELLYVMREYDIDIMAVTEFCSECEDWLESDRYFRYRISVSEKEEVYHIYHQGGTSNANGVAFILSEKAFLMKPQFKVLNTSSTVFDRLLTAQIEDFILILIYAPDQTNEGYHSLIQELIIQLESIPAVDGTFKLLLGDFNEKMYDASDGIGSPLYQYCVNNGFHQVSGKRNANDDEGETDYIYTNTDNRPELRVISVKSIPPIIQTKHPSIVRAKLFLKYQGLGERSVIMKCRFTTTQQRSLQHEVLSAIKAKTGLDAEIAKKLEQVKMCQKKIVSYLETALNNIPSFNAQNRCEAASIIRKQLNLALELFEQITPDIERQPIYSYTYSSALEVKWGNDTLNKLKNLLNCLGFTDVKEQDMLYVLDCKVDISSYLKAALNQLEKAENAIAKGENGELFETLKDVIRHAILFIDRFVAEYTPNGEWPLLG